MSVVIVVDAEGGKCSAPCCCSGPLGLSAVTCPSTPSSPLNPSRCRLSSQLCLLQVHSFQESFEKVDQRLGNMAFLSLLRIKSRAVIIDGVALRARLPPTCHRHSSHTESTFLALASPEHFQPGPLHTLCPLPGALLPSGLHQAACPSLTPGVS